MTTIGHLLAPLEWLGRRSTSCFVAGVFLGLVVPPLATMLRPLLVPLILLPFVIALMRIEMSAVLTVARRPLPVLALVAWVLVGAPLLVAAIMLPLGMPETIAAATITTAACAPLMASGALAMLLGLDIAFCMIAVVLATAIMPLSVPFMAFVLADLEIGLDAGALTLRLALMVGGTFLVARIARRAIGLERLERNRTALDGLAVIGFIGFAIGVMDGFTHFVFVAPGYVALCLLAVFALNVGLQAVTAAAFGPWLGCRLALTCGLAAGNNNMGIVLAAMADEAPFELMVFVAAAQFPIYLLPALQKRFYPRWLARETA